jgi:23S rRNA (cytosine1962-C5)-methyltransferase
MEIPQNTYDYELIDAGDGEKLERWGEYVLRRPDPQAIWAKDPKVKWESFDAIYERSNTGGGQWINNGVPEEWIGDFDIFQMVIRPTAFKHTGVFPEQSVNWEYIMKRVKQAKLDDFRILNLFAYTGGSTLAGLRAGANVVHVDASKGMTAVAKRNSELSRLNNNNVRFFVDDVIKFVQKETRRGNKYHGIVMDPPKFGRGVNGELWEIEKDLSLLLEDLVGVMADDFNFLIVNSYANEISRYSVENVLKDVIKDGKVYSSEIGLKLKSRPELALPCGSFVRWESI